MVSKPVYALIPIKIFIHNTTHFTVEEINGAFDAFGENVEIELVPIFRDTSWFGLKINDANEQPTQNAYIERFNRLFREDVLDAYLFEDLQQVRTLAEEWKDYYNLNPPHSTLAEYRL